MTSREGSIALPDGRALAWAEHGDPDATPVLFIAGAACGRSMTFGEDVLSALGILLITVDRPGMGASTPHDGRTLTTTADDLTALTQRWGSPLPVVANSQGAPFGLALAARGEASRLILVSPVDEVAVEPTRSLLPVDFRSLVDHVNADPGGAEEFFAAMGPSGMEEMVVGSADDGDRRVYTEEHFLRRYRRALGEGFANDGAGYAADARIAMSPWELPVEAIECDIELLMGAEDRQHSVDAGATLASRLLNARRTIVDDAGAVLLWTHAELVLRRALGDG